MRAWTSTCRQSTKPFPTAWVTLGIHVHKYYLHWAIWIPRVSLEPEKAPTVVSEENTQGPEVQCPRSYCTYPHRIQQERHKETLAYRMRGYLRLRVSPVRRDALVEARKDCKKRTIDAFSQLSSLIQDATPARSVQQSLGVLSALLPPTLSRQSAHLDGYFWPLSCR